MLLNFMILSSPERNKLLLHYLYKLVYVFEGNNICMLSGFHRDANKLLALLGCYAA